MACWFSAWSGAPSWLMRGFRAVFYVGDTTEIRPLRGVTASVALISTLAVWWLPHLRPAPLDLHNQIEQAQVFLGDIPCDYFNNLRDGWECSHYDDGTEITGRHSFWQNKFACCRAVRGLAASANRAFAANCDEQCEFFAAFAV